MQSIIRLVATASAVLLVATLSAASAQSPSGAASPGAMAMPMPSGTPTLTNARNLSARRLLPTGATLTGMLQQTSSCKKVGFKILPAHIVPPIYQAVQWDVRRMGCVILANHFVPASIAIGPTLRFVNVQAKNGSTRVPVH